MQWISVHDQLPESKERVLLYTPFRIFGNDHSCIGTKTSIRRCRTSVNGRRVPVFTHWMRLPEHPEAA